MQQSWLYQALAYFSDIEKKIHVTLPKMFSESHFIQMEANLTSGIKVELTWAETTLV